MKCPSCGAEINEGLPFCTSCGKPWAKQQSDMQQIQADISENDMMNAKNPDVQSTPIAVSTPQGDISKDRFANAVATQSKLPFHLQWGVITVAILLFFPVGIVLAIIRKQFNQKSPEYKKPRRVWIIVWMIIVVIVGLAFLPTDLDKAKALAKDGDYDSAIAILEDASDLSSNKRMLLSECYFRVGNAQSAVKLWEDYFNGIGDYGTISDDEVESLQKLCKQFPDESEQLHNLILQIEEKRRAKTATVVSEQSVTKPDTNIKEDAPAESTAVQKADQKAEPKADDYDLQTSFPPLATQYLFAKKYNIQPHTFPEVNTIIKWYDSVGGDAKEQISWQHLRCEVTLGSKVTRYKLTSEESSYLYLGETKDNCPNGLGLVVEVRSDDLERYFHNVYIGYFKDGYYDSYGLLYNDPSDNDISEYLYYRDYPDKKEFYAGEYQLWLNHVSYEGYFAKGKRSGKGNSFSISANAQYKSYYFQHGTIPEKMDFEIFTTVAEYENDKLNGNVTVYGIDGTKEYTGAMIKDKKSGKGIEYYPNTAQVKYEGEFKNDYYSGKGTLYDETGKVIYSGQWKDGDYA